jgi:hypothetical protein
MLFEPFQLNAHLPSLDRMQIGNRAFDYKVDGLANVGTVPDMLQHLRDQGLSDSDMAPLFSSAEGYIRMREKVGDPVTPAPNHAPVAQAGGPYLRRLDDIARPDRKYIRRFAHGSR